MAVERSPSAIGFTFRIKMQHHSCDFAPVSTVCFHVEQAQICDDVFLVVNGQRRIGGRGIGDIGIERRLLHGRSRNRLLIDQVGWTPWHIDDPYQRSPRLTKSFDGTTIGVSPLRAIQDAPC